MRKMSVKKDGGLMFLKGSWVKIRRQLLIVEYEVYTLKFTLILVYISVNDNTRNKLIEDEVLAIGKNIHRKYIIVRDFNGHIGITGK